MNDLQMTTPFSFSFFFIYISLSAPCTLQSCAWARSTCLISIAWFNPTRTNRALGQERLLTLVLCVNCSTMKEKLHCIGWLHKVGTTSHIWANYTQRFISSTVEQEIFACRKILWISRISRDLRNFPAQEYYLKKVEIFRSSCIPKITKFSCRQIA